MVRVRFAPSPTGKIHIGNVRAALFNYIFAKKTSGQLILRFEDTDKERSSNESARSIIEDLYWLGITFDEGPHKGGAYGPYRQSERLELYQEYAKELLQKGYAQKVYTDPPTSSQNQNYALRFCAGNQKVQFEDIVFGTLEKEVEDFIIVKSDGMPTFHFAVVVDDHLMRISHVIRGQDHLSNTPKHVLLARALGFTPPLYAHYSLTHGLSKRDQSTSIAHLRELGYLPQAIINAAMLLGWCPKDGVEKFNILDQLEYFSLNQFTKTNAHFDTKKFEWLAGQYMREADTASLFERAKEYLQAAQLITHSTPDSYVYSVLKLMQGNMTHLQELTTNARFFFEAPSYETALQETSHEASQKILHLLRDCILEQDILNADSFQTHLHTLTHRLQIKGKALFMPIRIALTGKTHGPELHIIAEILGKTEVLQRIAQYLYAITQK